MPALAFPQGVSATTLSTALQTWTPLSFRLVPIANITNTTSGPTAISSGPTAVPSISTLPGSIAALNLTGLVAPYLSQTPNIVIPKNTTTLHNATLSNNATIPHNITIHHNVTYHYNVTIPHFVCKSTFDACRAKAPTVHSDSTYEETQLAIGHLHQCREDFRSCAGPGPAPILSASPQGEDPKQVKRATDLNIDSFPTQPGEPPRNQTHVGLTVPPFSQDSVSRGPLLSDGGGKVGNPPEASNAIPLENRRIPDAVVSPSSVNDDDDIILPREKPEREIAPQGLQPLTDPPEVADGFKSRKGATGATKLPDTGYMPHSACPPECAAGTFTRNDGSVHEWCRCY